MYNTLEDFTNKTTVKVQVIKNNGFSLYLETLGDDPRVLYTETGFSNCPTINPTIEYLREHFGFKIDSLIESWYKKFEKELDDIIGFTEVGGSLIVKDGPTFSKEIKVCGFDTFGVIDEIGRVHIPRDILAFS